MPSVVSVCPRVCLSHLKNRCSIEKAEGIELVYGKHGTLGLFYTVF